MEEINELKRTDRRALVANVMRFCDYMQVDDGNPFRVKDAKVIAAIRKGLVDMKNREGKIFTAIFDGELLNVTRIA